MTRAHGHAGAPTHRRGAALADRRGAAPTDRRGAALADRRTTELADLPAGGEPGGEPGRVAAEHDRGAAPSDDHRGGASAANDPAGAERHPAGASAEDRPVAVAADGSDRGTRPSRLRELSRSLVLAELGKSGALSQAELVRSTGLSRATVASIVSDLRREGRVVASPGTESVGRGRPPALVHLCAGRDAVVGVDFGHSHLTVAVADLTGAILAEERVPMDVHGSPAQALDTAATMVGKLLAEAHIDHAPSHVVMGVPGPVDLRTGRLRSGTVLPTWEGLDATGELERRIGFPVTAENDANLGAVGEYRFGAGRGVDHLIFVKVSSGIGAGMLLDGRLYRGSRGTAGEIGHVQVREDGALCRCGSRGCLETVSSADAALALLAPAHGHDMTVDDLTALAAEGDPGTLRLLTDMGTAIGRVIAAVAANLDPALVIVGGAVATDALVEGISAAVHRYTQPYVSAEMIVVRSTLAERASLMGAIAIAIEAVTAN